LLLLGVECKAASSYIWPVRVAEERSYLATGLVGLYLACTDTCWNCSSNKCKTVGREVTEMFPETQKPALITELLPLTTPLIRFTVHRNTSSCAMLKFVGVVGLG